MEQTINIPEDFELLEPTGVVFKSSFEGLEVWKRSCRLAVSIYQETGTWKDWGLRDQMNRAAISIASNIAEGSERGTDPDYARFLRIAKGSSAELRTQLYIASKIGLIESSSAKILINESKQISSMLQGLITSIQ